MRSNITDAFPSSIKLSPVQQEVLDRIVHELTSTQDPAWPGRAILLWGDGVSASETARELKVSEETVRILRHRWFSSIARIAAAEKKVDKALAEIVSLIFQILTEEPAPEALTCPVGATKQKEPAQKSQHLTISSHRRPRRSLKSFITSQVPTGSTEATGAKKVWLKRLKSFMARGYQRAR